MQFVVSRKLSLRQDGCESTIAAIRIEWLGGYSSYSHTWAWSLCECCLWCDALACLGECEETRPVPPGEGNTVLAWARSCEDIALPPRPWVPPPAQQRRKQEQVEISTGAFKLDSPTHTGTIYTISISIQSPDKTRYLIYLETLLSNIWLIELKQKLMKYLQWQQIFSNVTGACCSCRVSVDISTELWTLNQTQYSAPCSLSMCSLAS